MWLSINNYFNFSKKERRGVWLLLIICVALFIAPSVIAYLRPSKTQQPPAEWQQAMAQIKVTADSNTATPYRSRYYPQKKYETKWRDYEEAEESDRPGRLFHFDPNTLDVEGWLSLGVKEKTAHTIQNYLAKGGRFRSADDIDRIYGLSPELVTRLKPWVQIAPDTSRRRTYFEKAYAAEQTAPPTMLDVNTADTAAFKSLPGIGSWLARRIVNFRDKLGGFHSLAQVAETRNLPDSTWQKIRERLVCKPSSIRKININTADTALLRSHPYIDKSLANNLVQYRNQHGIYRSAEDLRKLALMKEELFVKLQPYITIE
jgi:competence protein ComEA